MNRNTLVKLVEEVVELEVETIDGKKMEKTKGRILDVGENSVWFKESGTKTPMQIPHLNVQKITVT